MGINGRYKDAFNLRNLIKDFFNKTLLLTTFLANEDNLKIINVEKNINLNRLRLVFLGYEIKVASSASDSEGEFKRKLKLIVPNQVIKGGLISKGLANQEGKGKYVGKWIFLPDAEIIRRFNNLLTDLLEFYKIVDNSKKQLHEAVYIIKYSLLHTIAAKHRMTLMQVINKYTVYKKIGVKDGDSFIIFNEP